VIPCNPRRLNKDGILKGLKGGAVFSKDEYYTTKRIVNRDDKAYIGYSPAGLRENLNLILFCYRSWL
jgi:hypothetical protein